VSQDRHRWLASIESPTGEAITTATLEPDFEPVRRWAQFERWLQSGGGASAPVGDIEPLWTPAGQPPYVSGIRIGHAGSNRAYSEFPVGIFADSVSKAATHLVESGVLEAGQQFQYRVFAITGSQPDPVRPDGFEIEAIAEEPNVWIAELDPLLVRSSRLGSAGATPGAMPILVEQRVLDDATAQARTAGDLETGGILLGKLCRDPSGRAFVYITAQIPAEHTHATRESLRFTPETWACVQAARQLRGADELIVGWQHSHPHFCAQCPEARRSACPLSKPMFSAADRRVHREVFQSPWSVALLLSFLGDELPSYDVFAWQRGRIAHTEFYSVPAGFHLGDNQ